MKDLNSIKPSIDFPQYFIDFLGNQHILYFDNFLFR